MFLAYSSSAEMYRRNSLLTGIAIVGTLAGCGGDDVGTGGTEQTDGTEQANPASQDTGGTEEDGGTGQDGETEQTDDGSTDVSGVETHSGDWSGTVGGKAFSGNWQFETDFEAGDVTGWFTGDGEGNISGTVSGGKVDAKGGAAFGTVVWSGEFSSDGQEISGTWELAENIPGSGEWSGTVNELDIQTEDETEKETEDDLLLEEDQASGEEPITRYLDSVMLSYSEATSDKGTLLIIDYGTNVSIGTVADWYKQEVGSPVVYEDKGDSITIGYQFGVNEPATITISNGEYTNIHLEYLIPT